MFFDRPGEDEFYRTNFHYSDASYLELLSRVSQKYNQTPQLASLHAPFVPFARVADFDLSLAFPATSTGNDKSSSTRAKNGKVGVLRKAYQKPLASPGLLGGKVTSGLDAGTAADDAALTEEQRDLRKLLRIWLAKHGVLVFKKQTLTAQQLQQIYTVFTWKTSTGEN